MLGGHKEQLREPVLGSVHTECVCDCARASCEHSDTRPTNTFQILPLCAMTYGVGTPCFCEERCIVTAVVRCRIENLHPIIVAEWIVVPSSSFLPSPYQWSFPPDFEVPALCLEVQPWLSLTKRIKGKWQHARSKARIRGLGQFQLPYSALPSPWKHAMASPLVQGSRGPVGEEPQRSPADISQPLASLQTLEKIKYHCFQSRNLGMFCFTEFLWQEIYITEIMWARKQRVSRTSPLSPEGKFRTSNERFTKL